MPRTPRSYRRHQRAARLPELGRWTTEARVVGVTKEALQLGSTHTPAAAITAKTEANELALAQPTTHRLGIEAQHSGNLVDGEKLIVHAAECSM